MESLDQTKLDELYFIVSEIKLIINEIKSLKEKDKRFQVIQPPFNVFDESEESNPASIISEMLILASKALIQLIESVQEQVVLAHAEDIEESDQVIRLQARCFRLNVRVKNLEKAVFTC